MMKFYLPGSPPQIYSVTKLLIAGVFLPKKLWTEEDDVEVWLKLHGHPWELHKTRDKLFVPLNPTVPVLSVTYQLMVLLHCARVQRGKFIRNDYTHRYFVSCISFSSNRTQPSKN